MMINLLFVFWKGHGMHMALPGAESMISVSIKRFPLLALLCWSAESATRFNDFTVKKLFWLFISNSIEEQKQLSFE